MGYMTTETLTENHIVASDKMVKCNELYFQLGRGDEITGQELKHWIVQLTTVRLIHCLLLDSIVDSVHYLPKF